MKNATMLKRLVSALGFTLIFVSLGAIAIFGSGNWDIGKTTSTPYGAAGVTSNAACPPLADDSDLAFSPDVGAVSGEITWNDNDNAAGTRPDSVTVELYSSAQNEPISTKQVTEADGWKYSFGSFPKTSSDGNEIAYGIRQSGADGYATEYDAMDVVNTYASDDETVSVAVNIEWDDDNDRDGVRPDEVTIELDRHDEDRSDTENNPLRVALNAGNNWSHTFTVPAAKPGHSKEWLVGELVDTRTKREYSFEVPVVNVETGNQTVTIKNTHDIYRADVIVNNVWEDNGDTQMRPENVIVDVDNGERVETLTIGREDVYDDENGWQGVLKDVPRYRNGQEVEYTIKDVRVDSASEAEYETKYEAAVDESVDISYETRYDEHTPDDINQEMYKPADRYVNTYQYRDGDGNIAIAGTQVWYEGDAVPDEMTNQGNMIVPVGFEFKKWQKKDEPYEGGFDTVKNLSGEDVQIRVHTITYEPVLYQKFWAVGQSGDKTVLFIDACDKDKMPKVGVPYTTEYGVNYSTITHVGKYQDVVEISNDGTIPQVSTNKTPGKSDPDFQKGWQTLLSDNEIANVTDFVIGDNIKEKIQVKTLAGWFCGFENLANVDLRKIDTGKCVSMAAMFANCKNLSEGGIKGLEAEQLDTDNIVSMYAMFFASGVGDNIFAKLNNQNLHALKDTSFMFSDTPHIQNVLLGFDAPNLQNISYMFSKPTVLQNAAPALCNLSLKTVVFRMPLNNIVNARSVFSVNRELESITATGGFRFTMPKATDIGLMFQDCAKLKVIDGITTGTPFDAGSEHLVSATHMFDMCPGLTGAELHLEGIRFDRLDDANECDRMFVDCKNVKVFINKSTPSAIKEFLQRQVSNVGGSITESNVLFASEKTNVSNAVFLSPAYTNYAKSGFVVRHAGESADKGQGRTLGDKKIVFTIHHRIKKIEGSPRTAQISTVMPPAPSIPEAGSAATSSPASVGKLGDVLFTMLAASIAVSGAVAVGYAIHRKRGDRRR